MFMESWILRVSCIVNVKTFRLHLLCKRTEVFLIPWTPNIEFISLLDSIQKKPAINEFTYQSVLLRRVFNYQQNTFYQIQNVCLFIVCESIVVQIYQYITCCCFFEWSGIERSWVTFSVNASFFLWILFLSKWLHLMQRKLYVRESSLDNEILVKMNAHLYHSFQRSGPTSNRTIVPTMVTIVLFKHR